MLSDLHALFAKTCTDAFVQGRHAHAHLPLLLYNYQLFLIYKTRFWVSLTAHCTPMTLHFSSSIWRSDAWPRTEVKARGRLCRKQQAVFVMDKISWKRRERNNLQRGGVGLVVRERQQFLSICRCLHAEYATVQVYSCQSVVGQRRGVCYQIPVDQQAFFVLNADDRLTWNLQAN
jgi:hypothetical protein